MALLHWVRNGAGQVFDRVTFYCENHANVAYRDCVPSIDNEKVFNNGGEKMANSGHSRRGRPPLCAINELASSFLPCGRLARRASMQVSGRTHLLPAASKALGKQGLQELILATEDKEISEGDSSYFKCCELAEAVDVCRRKGIWLYFSTIGAG
jgi:hypothetical protein